MKILKILISILSNIFFIGVLFSQGSSFEFQIYDTTNEGSKDEYEGAKLIFYPKRFLDTLPPKILWIKSFCIYSNHKGIYRFNDKWENLAKSSNNYLLLFFQHNDNAPYGEIPLIIDNPMKDTMIPIINTFETSKFTPEDDIRFNIAVKSDLSDHLYYYPIFPKENFPHLDSICINISSMGQNIYFSISADKLKTDKDPIFYSFIEVCGYSHYIQKHRIGELIKNIEFSAIIELEKNAADIFPISYGCNQPKIDLNEFSFLDNSTINFEEGTRTHYDNVIFTNPITMVGHPEEKVYFKNCLFTDAVSIKGAIFDSTLSFNGSCFLSSFKFENNVKFNNHVTFNDVEFGTSTIFENVSFTDAFFYHAQLPQRLIFNNVKIDKNIDLADVYPNPCCSKTKLLLCKTNTRKINIIIDEHFALEVPQPKDLNNGDEMNRQVDENHSKDWQSYIYQGLLIRARQEGYSQSYEIIDKQYIEFEYNRKKNWKMWFAVQNWIDKVWWGYGYNKENILRNTLILLFLFSFINVFLLKKYIEEVYSIDFVEKSLNKIHTSHVVPIYGFFRKLLISVYYTSIVFFSIRIDIDELAKSKDKHQNENSSGSNNNTSQNQGKWRINKIVLVSFFWLIYATGKICLGYLANYIITSGT